MERFFSKKSVAVFLTTIVLFGFLSYNISTAVTPDPNTPLAPQVTSPNTNSAPTNLQNTAKVSPQTKTVSGINCTNYPRKTDGPNSDEGGQSANLANEKINILCKAQIENKGVLMETDLSRIETINSKLKELLASSKLNAADREAALSAMELGGKVLEVVKDAAGGLANYLAGASTFPFFLQALTILEVIKMVLSWWLAVCGAIFDLSINFSIINIKYFFEQAGPLEILWTMMRDLANISFIFLLLYVAISQIIGSFGPKAKTTLVSIIISALLINFSMFFTKILIDASNMVAVALYNSYGSYSMGLGIVDQSLRMMKDLHLLAIIKNSLSITGQTNMLGEQIGQLLVMGSLTAAYIFGAVLLLGRTVMLVFLSMLSPIGFVGKSIPGLGSYSDSWWKSLKDQLLVAPMLMFILLVTARLMENNFIYNMVTTAQLNHPQTAGEFLAPPTLNVAVYLYYFVCMTLLWKGLLSVKKMSGVIGDMAMSSAKAAIMVSVAAATGGASVAVGAMGATGGAAVAAEAAGGSMARRAATRLAFSARNLGSTMKDGKSIIDDSKVGKLLVGKGDKTTFVGKALSGIRDKADEQLKNVTGGEFSVDTYLKGQKKLDEEKEKALIEKMDKLGPKKAMEDQKQMKDTLENVTKEAEARAKVKSDDHTKAETEHEKAKKAVENAEEKRAQADKKGGDPYRFNEADQELKTAKAILETADAKVKTFTDGYKTQLEAKKAEVAAEMGVDLTKLNESLKKTEAKIVSSIKTRNEAIRDTLENGSYWGTLVFGDARKKIAAKARAQKINLGKSSKELMKEAAKKAEEEDGGKDESGEESGGGKNPNNAPIV